MQLKLWVESNLHPDALDRLAALAKITTGSDPANADGQDGIIIGTRLSADASFFDLFGKSLKVVARPGIGLDNVDIHAATERDILVINTPDAPSESTAEHAVALLLALAKRVVPAHLSLSGAQIERDAMLGTELLGLTLGVIGYGRIGKRVSEICGAGLRMQVLVYEPYLRPEDRAAKPAWVTFAGSLDDLLGRCDVLTLHASLTDQTHHLLGDREFGLMKKGSYLVNVSRGPVIDEAALVAALRSDHLAGAALDVFEIEPPKPDNPLLSLPSVIATPHVASFTEAARRAMGAGIVRQIGQILDGQPPDHLVNPDAWPGKFAQKETT